jgi:acetolactate synthase I/II/III large subunit
VNGATILIEALKREGVDVVFGYPGGAIMPVYDALLDSGIKHVLVRHEQGAALAADGYARVSGKVGVCMATSGPGATNLVTGIANAFLDSVPMVAITGQVPTHFIGTDAFQEVDIFGITMPVVKHSYIIRKIEDIPRVMQEAFNIARSGRPGPVLVDLPKDVATAKWETPEFPIPEYDEVDVADVRDIEEARQLMAQSQRPLIYAGGGIRIADACGEFRRFVEATGIPVVATLQGLGALPANHPQNLGMLGMHGTKAANYAVQGCDLLICIGARFDDRVTGKLQEFAPNARVIHMDIDAAEISKLRFAHCSLRGDIKFSMNALHVRPEINGWKEKCAADRDEFAFRYDAPGESVYAPAFIKELSDRAGDNVYISCDVGQHQMWVAQHYAFDHPRKHLTSGGLGTMGFGLPAAIGAQYAEPAGRIITISGDGSIMMNIQEFATIKRYNLPVKVVVFDNQALGMVRQWQTLFFQERYSEVDLSDNPDFANLVEAFGIPAIRVTQRDEVSGAIDALLSTDGPLFVHVCIDPMENVWPLVPPGKNNSQMMEATA